VRYGFIDDYEAVKSTSKESGATRNMIEQRFAAYYDKMKLYYISTPELKQTSNIEPVYLAGDQRRYKIPCPICGTYIHLEWSTVIAGTDGKEMGGITWKTNSMGRLIEDSVGYVCQVCGEFFNDKNKFELNLAGFWEPTAEPQEKNLYSYHLSSLYAPPGMYDWKFYVQQYISACPEGGKRDESKYKAFVNLALGITYEEQGEAPKANELQKNIRNYEIATIPEKLSEKDGNGKIMLLTCACDLNGTEQDARLDYEVLAWAESGSSYSILHGSIGTFVPRENTMRIKEDREKWTYEHFKPNSVWPEFTKVLETIFETDTGRKMKVFISGVDTGHYTNYAYDFLDKTNLHVIGLKGDGKDKMTKVGMDVPNFKQGRERRDLYIVSVNQIKDDIAHQIKLRWDENNDDAQPPGFMNYPIPSEGKYLFKNYFSHFEAEQRITETKEGEGIAARWVKKASNVQNHFFDVRVYNMVLKDVLVWKLATELKQKNFTWNDYVNALLGRK
jgi:phage terminase large subunit GpA-like protein